MGALLFDLRLSFRGLLRDYGFSVTAIATLAVALALNVTVHTIRDAMVVRGLPLASDSKRLAYLAVRQPSDPACCPGPMRYADFETFRANARSFEDLAFGPVHQPVTFRADGRLIDTTVSRLTANTLGLLGVRPVLGRDFTAADAIRGAPNVVLVSHEFWNSRLGKRADIVGLSVQINGAPASIVGVLPERFAIVYPQDLYMPFGPARELESWAIGRLKADATLEEARAQLDTITNQLEAADGVARGEPLVRTYAQTYIAADAPRIYGALWGGAWLVLLIACANLTNLTLVRTIGRWREFSTRVALGAGQRRMARQMLIESLVLTAAATAIAWPIIKWSVRMWANATASRYLVLDYSITFETLAYLMSIAIAAAIAIAALPIARVMQVGVSDTLKGDARGATQGLRRKQLTTALVGGQMALSIVLLLGAGVLIRSFEKIVGADAGVRDADRIAIGLLGLPSDKYPTAAARTAFFARLDAQLRTIAGADEVAIASTIPTRGVRVRPIEIDGRPTTPEARDLAQVPDRRPQVTSEPWADQNRPAATSPARTMGRHPSW